MCFVLLALLLPQPTPGSLLLAAPATSLSLTRNLNRLVKTRFGFVLGVGGQGLGIGSFLTFLDLLSILDSRL